MFFAKSSSIIIGVCTDSYVPVLFLKEIDEWIANLSVGITNYELQLMWRCDVMRRHTLGDAMETPIISDYAFKFNCESYYETETFREKTFLKI